MRAIDVLQHLQTGVVQGELGMALAAKLDQLSYRTFVLLGDSEMAEGQVWEAVQWAGHKRLDNIVAMLDVNRLGQSGSTMLGHNINTYAARLKSFPTIFRQ